MADTALSAGGDPTRRRSGREPRMLRGAGRVLVRPLPGHRLWKRAFGRLFERFVLFASSWRAGLRQRRGARHGSASIPAALSACGSSRPDQYRMLRSHHEVVLARASLDGSDVVVRIGRSGAGSRALDNHARMVEEIHALGASCLSWSSLVPSVLDRGTAGGAPFVVEEYVPGTSVSELTGDERSTALEATAEVVARMHGDTAVEADFDETCAQRMIDQPVDALSGLPGTGGKQEGLEALRQWLRRELVGHRVELCCVHGDLWAGNVLVSSRSDPAEVVGIVDWEDGSPAGLAAVDDAHLWLTEQPGEIGEVVVESMAHPEKWDRTKVLADGQVVVGTSELPAAAVMALAWLGHVAATAGRTTERSPGRLWIRRNVLPVAEAALAFREHGGESGDAEGAPPARPVTTSGPAEGEPRPRRALTTPDVVAVTAVGVAAALWIVGAWGVDPADMTGTGFVSLMTPPMLAGLLVLSIGFVWALRRGAPGWVLGLHVLVLIALVHGTPAAVYDTLRYSWSWKHTGIVEFIMRNGMVDTTAENLPIYHSWPGFFAGGALLTDLVGSRSVIRIAIWAPVAFNLGNLLALRYLYRSLGVRDSVLWLAVWIFFVSNWVGQDYFAPQAMAYLLYLVLIASVLRGFRRPGRWAVPAGSELARPAALAVFVVLMAAIASSHQITPFIALVALAMLVVIRQVRGWYLPVAAGAMTFTWAATVGRGVSSGEFDSILESFGRPLSNAEETLAKASTRSDAQQLISGAGRIVILAVLVLAAVGAVRMLHRRRLDPVLFVFVAAPAIMPLVTEFGGEVLFRVFLFAVPALALLGARAVAPVSGDARGSAEGPVSDRMWSRPRTALVLVVVLILQAGFILAYYGKDQQYYFSESEIEAAMWVADNAPEETLLVEGSTNYPSRARNQEHFTHVPISVEPEESWREILADPAGRLEAWLSDPDFDAAYVLITNGQKVDVDVNGPLPVGSLEEVEQALRASPAFRVAFDTADGTVFELAGAGP